MSHLGKEVDVLVLTDDPQVLYPYLNYFEKSRFHFSCFHDEKSALNFLKKNLPHIVMSGEGFIPFLKSARKILPTCGRIFLTEEHHLDKIQQAINYGDVYRVVSLTPHVQDFKKALEDTWEYQKLLNENQQLLNKAQEQSHELNEAIKNIEYSIEERSRLLEESHLEISQTEAELSYLNKFMRHISMAMTLEEVEKWVESELKKIIHFDSLILSLDNHKPYLEKKLGEFTVAFPLVYGNKHLGHIYLKGKNENLVERVHQYLGFLQQVAHNIAVTVDRISVFNKASENKRAWEATFDAIVDPVSILNKNYEVVRANRAYSTVSEEKLQDVIGKKCFKVFEGRTSFCEGCYMSHAFDAGQPILSDIVSQKQKRKYKATSYPVHDDAGSVKFIVQYYKDITRELEYKDQLIRSEKTAELGILAGSIAHEINNPLGGILAFSQILKAELKRSDELYKDIVDIERACLRCKDIIDNLLNFARQSQAAESELHHLQDIIRMSISLIEYQAKHYNIEFSKTIASDPIYIKGNFNQLWQAIVNILENAIEAVLEKKTGKKIIKIKLSKKGSMAEISLINNGSPIPRENLGKIFNPLYTTKDPDTNPGLGLSMSLNIVRDHGGNLTVFQNKKRETVFCIHLPVAKK